MRKYPDKAKEEGTGLSWLAHTSVFQSIPAGKLRQQELKAPRGVTVKSRENVTAVCLLLSSLTLSTLMQFRTQPRGDGATHRGLGPPIPMSAIKTGPIESPH